MNDDISDLSVDNVVHREAMNGDISDLSVDNVVHQGYERRY